MHVYDSWGANSKTLKTKPQKLPKIPTFLFLLTLNANKFCWKGLKPAKAMRKKKKNQYNGQIIYY